MDVMTNSPRNRSWRAPVELALAVSVMALAAALALRWFVGLGEGPIVIGTIVIASIIGWRQPEARVRPVLQPVRVRSRRSTVG